LEKQKGIPSLLKTTLNATHTMPGATLSQGNERVTRMKILDDFLGREWAL
jgi:hypothetical protein